MGYQPLEDLLPKANFSVYKLCRLAARRAQELADGAPNLVSVPASAKTATIALEEIAQGKVVLKDAAHLFGPEQNKKIKKTVKEERVEQEQAV